MNALHTLVIACGNPLRGDDGVGPAAADIVKSWKLPGVKVLAVHQIVPELIDEIRKVERVLFIDAGTTIVRSFQAGIVELKKSRRFFGHHDNPANLLALVHELEGRTPVTWLVSISGLSFDHGEEITSNAQEHLHAAVAWIRDFLVEPSCTKLV